MPSHDFLFVDESGDPGFQFDSLGSLVSSPYYVASVLHVSNETFRWLNAHIASFRYFTGLHKELKLPPEKPIYERLLLPISSMASSGDCFLRASTVYLDKLGYNGHYLKPGGTRPADPIRFRNYILRRLLERHFSAHKLQSEKYDLVLDRIDMTPEQKDNLFEYLRGNWNIPTPTHVTHASSIYVEPLQIVHHIAAGYKDIMTRTATEELAQCLSFVSVQDITIV